MATVHPSRMGLVPQDPPRRNNDSFRRPPSPNRRSRTPERARGRSGSPRRDDDARRDHGTSDRRPSPSYDRYRGRSRSRSRSAERGPAPNAPWRQAGSMYPPRDGRGREPLPHMQGPPPGFGQDHGYGPRGGGGPRPGPNDHYGGGGSAWLESRRQQRAATTLSIWPKSPERSRNDSDDDRHRSSKKRSKRRRSPSSDSDSSDSDRDRRRRKDKKRSRHSKSDKKKSHSSRHKRRYSDDDESEESDSDDRRRRQHDRSKSRSRTPRRADSPRRRDQAEDEDDWVEKPTNALLSTAAPTSSKHLAAAAAPADDSTIDDDADEPGPQLPGGKTGGPRALDERAYGGQLLRGEGSAMAAFLQGEDGTKTRIPRRGEIGLLPDQIEQFESVGYVMSGSRHRRMNAVRMRKENQVISAEEKRAVLKLQKEERERREALLREEFKELVQDKLKTATAGPRL